MVWCIWPCECSGSAACLTHKTYLPLNICWISFWCAFYEQCNWVLGCCSWCGWFSWFLFSINNFISLPKLVLNNFVFSFQGKFYKHLKGAAMCSPVYLVIANIHMEYIENIAFGHDTLLLVEKICGWYHPV